MFFHHIKDSRSQTKRTIWITATSVRVKYRRTLLICPCFHRDVALWLHFLCLKLWKLQIWRKKKGRTSYHGFDKRSQDCSVSSKEECIGKIIYFNIDITKTINISQHITCREKWEHDWVYATSNFTQGKRKKKQKYLQVPTEYFSYPIL